MQLPRIVLKTLRDLRWQVFWYGTGFAILAAMMVFIYPSYHDQLSDFELPDALKALIGNADYSSPEGFLTAEFFSWIYILGIVFALMAGTSALGGEEAAGTLDLLLAQPITRRRVAIEKMVGIGLSCLLICAIACIGWILSLPFSDMDVSLGDLLFATFLLVPLMTAFAAFSVFCAAWLPDRRLATGVVTAVAVASFFADYLGALVDVVAPFRWASVIFYYRDINPLLAPVDVGKLAFLLGLTLLFSALAVVMFEGREIGVNAVAKLPFRWRLARGQAA